jgi:FlaA1/EpsC-like NDP-sugar epimerase
MLRLDDPWPKDMVAALWVFPLAVVVPLAIMATIGSYKSVLRHMTSDHFFRIIVSLIVSVAIVLSIWVFLRGPNVPRSVWGTFLVLSILLMGCLRLFVRSALGRVVPGYLASAAGNAVIIYGAGEAGIQLGHALRYGHKFKPVAFVDDSKHLHGSRVLGLPVRSPKNLSVMVERYACVAVLLAMPSASRGRRSEILRSIEPLGTKVLVVPGLNDLVDGTHRVDELREIDIEDLLERDTVAPDQSLLKRRVTGLSVMVTGGGGSIGSELCRQILSLRAKRLVVFDHSEFALYEIKEELEAVNSETEVVTVLGTVLDRHIMSDTMSRLDVDTVFHAAAYKHVDLVEENVISGVRNIVFGTDATAAAAAEAAVSHFVLISTDKAVRPAGVMGGSKRLAELVIQAAALEFESVRFGIVRFGNVLNSSGSVVPKFRKQIRSGGPVIVRDRNAMRFFMTIPEAAELVIQAGSMAQGGEIFLLDMGRLVLIETLAKRMIRLSGYEVRDDANPNGDINIKITQSLRGEKVREELLIDEDAVATEHPRIMRDPDMLRHPERVREILRQLDAACAAADTATVRRLSLGVDVWIKEGTAARDCGDPAAVVSPRKIAEDVGS